MIVSDISREAPRHYLIVFRPLDEVERNFETSFQLEDYLVTYGNAAHFDSPKMTYRYERVAFVTRNSWSSSVIQL